MQQPLSFGVLAEGSWCRPSAYAGGAMRQSRLMSLVEALVNVAVGYAVAVLTQVMVFPLFGLKTTLPENLAIGAIFTAVSLARSYGPFRRRGT